MCAQPNVIQTSVLETSGFPRVLAFSLALLDSFSLFAARHLAASFAFLSHVFPVAFH